VRRALDGVRVLDLTRVWAGPHATRMLADLGADVIHVSSRKLAGELTVAPATARILGVYPNDEPGERHWNRNSQLNDLMRNKRDITLEFDTPEGLALVRRLVAEADVVIENYSPRVMPKYGLGFEALRAINRRVILCSMPGYGSSGPLSGFISYGTNVDPASGLASLMGYHDDLPHLGGNAYPDPVAALFAVGAILVAMRHQRNTGEGQYLDLSQCEATTAMLGEFSLAASLGVALPARDGNRLPDRAPNDAYPCRGEDRWIAISVADDRDWRALCAVAGRSDWAQDPRFATTAARLANLEALDAALSAWTSGEDRHDLMYRLQQAGVAAGAVLDARDLVEDANLGARGFFQKIDAPEVGPMLYAGQPVRLSETPVDRYRPAPCLGQHNEEVLRDLLGLGEMEIADLKQRGLIGDRPAPAK
jgi:crotonobetainyl-CoA:carnitine CoA-transferase CaiB-like acyl-CoA transferase